MGLWIGGMAVLDFVEAPVRFGTGLLTRNQAVGLGQEIFARFNRVELGLALLALAGSAVVRTPRWSVSVVGAMVILAAVQAGVLTPAISHLAQGLDFVHRTPGDPRYASIRALHTAYAALEVVLLGAGLAVLAAWARPEGRREAT